MLISISSMQHKPKTNLILMFPSGGTFFETDKKVSLSFLPLPLWYSGQFDKRFGELFLHYSVLKRAVFFICIHY